METQIHPDNEQLLAFFEQPEAAHYQDIAGHLATCIECRKRASALENMTVQIHRLAPEEQALGEEHPTAGMIDGYTHNSLDRALLRQVRAHLKVCSSCQKRVLHQRSRVAQLNPRQNECYRPGTAGMFKAILSRRISAWAGISAGAVFAGLVAFAILVLPLMLAAPEYQLIDYRDDIALTIVKQGSKAPGIGFFSQPKTQRIPYPGLEAHYDEALGFVFQWVPVTDAQTYNLELAMIVEQSIVPLGQWHGDAIQTNFPSSAPIPGRRYVWKFTGDLPDNGRFKMTGGFVVQSP